jgi:coproporphyrinogen III oxidase-like Fe-S oxidoreductase
MERSLEKNLDEKRKAFIDEFISESTKRPNVLYVHTPFCSSRCLYCIYDSTDKYSMDELDHFYEIELKKQIESYGDVFSSVVFDQVYFGGGTPTIISADRLRYVFELIPGFSGIKNKCIESTPQTLTDGHIQLLREYGFSFLSVGIQSLDKTVCKKQNRPYLSRSEFLLLSEKLNGSGIYFNYDLICYMNCGDIRDIIPFRDELSHMIRVGKPNGITIHQLTQSYHSIEKTGILIKTIREVLMENEAYSCVNSLLSESDALNDTLHNAEYKLERDKTGYSHYMWNKYPTMPMEGYNVLSLGFYKDLKTFSSAGRTFFCEAQEVLSPIDYDPFIFESYKHIRDHLRMPL